MGKNVRYTLSHFLVPKTMGEVSAGTCKHTTEEESGNGVFPDFKYYCSIQMLLNGVVTSIALSALRTASWTRGETAQLRHS